MTSLFSTVTVSYRVVCIDNELAGSGSVVILSITRSIFDLFEALTRLEHIAMYQEGEIRFNYYMSKMS